MARVDITRTELVWPGKYDEDGERVVSPRVNLPFQSIETVNESRATREAMKRPAQTSLFDFWQGDEGETFEDGWRNKLIWGDNALVMSSLLTQYAGKIDLIYIDPPFATGSDFSFSAPIGDTGEEAFKEQSIVEEKAYRDTWGAGISSYLVMMNARIQLIRDLLSPNGTVYVHCDERVNSALRSILDETFGLDRRRNEIVWHYPHMSNVRQDFARKHDTIYRYSKGDTWTFNLDEVREPYDEQTLRRYEKAVVFPGGYEAKANPLGKAPDDVWRIPPIRNVSAENQNFPTQKPEALLERIVKASSRPGDVVADFFCGSGTTLAVAEKLGRRWIGCDLGRWGIHITRKRLLSIEGSKPFEVMNLGKYERQYWQTSSFGGRDPQQVLFEYLWFILRLHGAVPVPGMQYLHGKKEGAVVHVGPVDAPVTIDEVVNALDECVATGQQELHVLGWEWEMGLNDTVDQLAVARKVRMRLLAIPREVMEPQAVDRGDIRFFELAHLDCTVEMRTGRQVAIVLTGFAMSGADGMDPEVLAKIERWSDFVDYWAVDWDFRNDSFVNGWVAYRTRRERRLVLKSDAHTYEAPGTYRIAVKVVDIFGNDTTKIFPVEVR